MSKSSPLPSAIIADRAAIATEFVIRPRQADDLDALFRLFNQPRCRMGLASDPFSSRDELQAWLELEGSERINLVAAWDEEPVGLASLSRCRGALSHIGWLSLYVHDSFQGRGVGSLMLAATIATADRFLGLRRLQLSVLCDNAPAISLYQKFGFGVEGRHSGFVRRGLRFLDAHTMARLTVTQADRVAPSPRAGETGRTCDPLRAADASCLQPRSANG